MRHFKIITQDDCKYCDRAKALIREMGDTFSEINLSTFTEEARGAFKKRYGTVPQVFLETVRIGGSDDLAAWYAT
ncbi:glutaredoxin 3 [Pseudaminobacter sp. 19-2017]|uniref:Glutaredoxin 3 n=1 Tax=Pseudaminobacter soli (ex Zhang et al. 2022) TaxID=2831468 RepID=A0A942E197_9HYPH|nr:glutaredoxin domain-containing protein [Pseudaminobacter soli]MBS3648765.1 glutaredoxin 3 [Pseudaminobacter soli]